MQAMISRRQMLALLGVGPAFIPTLRAAPQAEFSTGVNIVSLLVTVRDKSGKFVNDLEQDDFTVEDEGRPQAISYFSRQDDLPLTLGLLVDISGSQAMVLDEELAASAVFFKQVLREGVDQAFLKSFAARAWLMQNVTPSRAKLEEALGILGSGLKDRRLAAGTVLYDAVTDATGVIMKKLQGRKALVLLTDGEDTASRGSIEQAVASCQRYDTVAYSVGLGSGLSSGRAFLEEISKKTGGRFLRSRRRSRWTQSTAVLNRNCATNTTSGICRPPCSGQEERKRIP